MVCIRVVHFSLRLEADRFAVTHASEVSYVFGGTAVTSDNASVRFLSKTMVDYWLSFVVSGSPNDGKGSSSACLLPRYPLLG